MSYPMIIGYRSAVSESVYCVQCLDTSCTAEGLYEGEDFSCVYCGEEWRSFVGMTANERTRAEMAARGEWHCDDHLIIVREGEACEGCEIGRAHEAALVLARRLSLRQRRNPNLTMAGMMATHHGLRCVQCFGYGNGLCASHEYMDWSAVSRLTEPMWGAELHGPWNPGVGVCPSVGNGCTHTSVVDDGAVVACAL